MSAPQEIRDLVMRFEENKASYLNPSYNETQLRRDFLDPFFKALGWDIDNALGYSEAYRDVVHEDTIRIGSSTKAPDYGFRVGGTRKFFVEAKKPSVKIKDDPAPAYQLRRYAWSAKLQLSILTDFEELAVYDCRVKPDSSDAASKARLKYFKYNEYIDRWDEIYSIFSKDSVLKGSFDRFVVDKKNKRGTATVDNEFLAQIESWRESLAKNIALRNKHLNVSELNHVVQATIDRIIFLRICEDRGIEPPNRLMQAVAAVDIYSDLINYFKEADEKYNSGLFHFENEKDRKSARDQVSLEIKIDNKVLKEIIGELYYPKSPYEFSVLPAEILGQVYEKFLGKVIRLTASGLAKVELKPEVKKAKGVFYTPTYIVDYIVKHTIGALIEGKSVGQIADFAIVDPACGSGSFLLVAYQFLLDWYLKYYLENPDKFLKGKIPKLIRTQKGTYKLTIHERKRILTTHIFGVDLDPQAVEVTKLSLLLKVLEGETSQTLIHGMRLIHERALPDLDQNIQCGNSLVGVDLYNGSLDLDEEWKDQVNPFDWASAFPHIFKGGGFDVVIGNPPYVYRKATEANLKPYYKNTYATAEGNFELYKFFLERSHSLCSSRGTVGMIVSSTFLVQPSSKKLRNFLLNKSSIIELCPLGPRVFENATVDTTILVHCPAPPRSGHVVQIRNPRVPTSLEHTTPYAIKQDRFSASSEAVIDYRLDQQGYKIVQSLLETFPPVDHGFDVGVGINTGYIKDELVSGTKVDERYHPMTPGTGIARYGEVTTKGWIMYDKAFVQSKGDRGRSLPAQYYFDSEKILVARTRNLSLSRRIVATLDEDRTYNLNRLSNIVARKGYSIIGFLGILNSSLFNWLFSTRYFDYEIKPIYISSAPMADSNDERLCKLVLMMLKLVKSRATLTLPKDFVSLDRKIAALEVEIDERVYALYGINTVDAKHIAIQLAGWESSNSEFEPDDPEEELQDEV